MTFSWTPHRFSGGALALDVANSVILRFDREHSVDRFATADQLDAFPNAAMQHCAETQDRALMPVPQTRIPAFLALREAIDLHFRTALQDSSSPRLLADLLEQIAATLRSAHAGDLDYETAQSALRLAASPSEGRMKICPNCQWLFIDRSKNKSRSWCDMAVCGNRVKARLHYRKRKEGVQSA
jgi:predicted RNA-binding Zn ribbon-like protein